ncbi:MAG: hypothetical protein Alpg2KO_08270 [Alphaproteobacteria bacterium]
MSPARLIGILIAFVLCVGGVVGYVWAESYLGGLIRAEIDRTGQPYSLQYTGYDFTLWNQSVRLEQVNMAAPGVATGRADSIQSYGLKWQTEPSFRITGVRSAEIVNGFADYPNRARPSQITANRVVIKSPTMTDELMQVTPNMPAHESAILVARAIDGMEAERVTISEVKSGIPNPVIGIARISSSRPPNATTLLPSQYLVIEDVNILDQSRVKPEVMQLMMPNRIEFSVLWQAGKVSTTSVDIDVAEVKARSSSTIEYATYFDPGQGKSSQAAQSALNDATFKQADVSLVLGQGELSDQIRQKLPLLGLLIGGQMRQQSDPTLRAAMKDITQGLAKVQNGSSDRVDIRIANKGSASIGDFKKMPERQLFQQVDVKVSN